MNRIATHETLDQDDVDTFIYEPRIFMLAHSSLSNSIDEFNAYFKAKQNESGASAFPAEKIVENAGRVCYLSFARQSESTRAYVEKLVRNGHESVLEHVTWTFVLTGVSRAFTHQLVRHRVGFAYSQLSQQYVDHRTIRFVVPAEILDNPALEQQWKHSVLSQREQYALLLEKLGDRKSDREKLRSTRSAARSVLPNCMEAIVAVTGNARAWRHFLHVRGSIVGNFEMRRVCTLLLSTLKQEAPSIFFDFTQQTLDDGWPIVKKIS